MAVTALAYTAKPADAGQKFSCGNSKGIPVTVAQHSQGPLTVIRWKSAFFSGSGYTPQSRCQLVSQRFQDYYQKGKLNFLTTGIMNRQKVVCVAEKEGGPCSGLLFTLKPSSDPGRTLQQLLDFRVGAAGPLTETSERIYIDFNKFLDAAPVDTSVTFPQAPTTAKPAPESSPAVW